MLLRRLIFVVFSALERLRYVNLTVRISRRQTISKHTMFSYVAAMTAVVLASTVVITASHSPSRQLSRTVVYLYTLEAFCLDGSRSSAQ